MRDIFIEFYRNEVEMCFLHWYFLLVWIQLWFQDSFIAGNHVISLQRWWNFAGTLIGTFGILCTSTLQKKKKKKSTSTNIQNIQLSCIKEKNNLAKWLDDKIPWTYPVNQASAGHSAFLKPVGKSRCEPSNFTYSSSEVNETPAELCLSFLALIEATQFCLSWRFKYDMLFFL